MKPDIYSKAVLTVIAGLLAVVAFRPSLDPELVQAAQQASPKRAVSAPAPMSSVHETYSYCEYTGGGIAAPGQKDLDDLNAIGREGNELVAAIPMQNKRMDNLAMGTAEVLYVFRMRSKSECIVN
jgi:hypothetical protein